MVLDQWKLPSPTVNKLDSQAKQWSICYTLVNCGHNMMVLEVSATTLQPQLHWPL
jgi:hypothetical protein